MFPFRGGSITRSRGMVFAAPAGSAEAALKLRFHSKARRQKLQY
jgi:hypothetical protein